MEHSALCPTTHAACTLEGKTFGHTVGRGKGFDPLGTWLPDVMSQGAVLLGALSFHLSDTKKEKA